jgi:hypothetical protein
MRETAMCVKKQMIEKGLRYENVLIEWQKQGWSVAEFIYPFFCVFWS